MATHGFQNGGDTAVSLPEVVPFDFPHRTRLSWELGSRVVDDDGVFHSKWEQTDSRWSLSIFCVAEHTVILCVRTPVGRERFYAAAKLDLERALPHLESTSNWHRCE